MVFEAVTGTVDQLIDYALMIVGIMLVWYGIKFFMVAPPTKAEKDIEEAEQARRGAEGRAWIKEKWEERKSKEKKAGKRNLVSPIKDNLIHVIEATEDVVDLIGKVKTAKDYKVVLRSFKKVNQEIDSAWRNLRLLRRKFKGEEKEFLNKLLAIIEGTKENFNENVKDKLPEFSPDFLKEAKGVIPEIKHVRGMIGNALKEVEEFHE